MLNVILAPLLEIYVNGRKIASDNTHKSCSASDSANPNLLFGGAGASNNQYWGMHIDDFAVWDGRKLTSGEITYIINKGKWHER